MALNLVTLQNQILEHFENAIPQRVIEQAIPDAQTVLRTADGKIPYYVAIQFGDIQNRFRGKTFAGTRHDDYDLIMYTQVIGPDPKMVRTIASENVLDALLGFEADWASHIVKRPGGGMWPLTQSNGATEAYMFPGSWAITFQLNPS